MHPSERGLCVACRATFRDVHGGRYRRAEIKNILTPFGPRFICGGRLPPIAIAVAFGGPQWTLFRHARSHPLNWKSYREPIDERKRGRTVIRVVFITVYISMTKPGDPLNDTSGCFRYDPKSLGRTRLPTKSRRCNPGALPSRAAAAGLSRSFQLSRSRAIHFAIKVSAGEPRAVNRSSARSRRREHQRDHVTSSSRGHADCESPRRLGGSAAALPPIPRAILSRRYLASVGLAGGGDEARPNLIISQCPGRDYCHAANAMALIMPRLDAKRRIFARKSSRGVTTIPINSKCVRYMRAACRHRRRDGRQWLAERNVALIRGFHLRVPSASSIARAT